jgi:hypothetical protein
MKVTITLETEAEDWDWAILYLADLKEMMEEKDSEFTITDVKTTK